MSQTSKDYYSGIYYDIESKQMIEEHCFWGKKPIQ